MWINEHDEIAFFENDNLKLIQFSDLKPQIMTRLASNDKLIISLKAERDATYRMFVDVLDELKLAGATRISIAEPEQ